jgi:hypothetical protein
MDQAKSRRPYYSELDHFICSSAQAVFSTKQEREGCGGEYRTGFGAHATRRISELARSI